MFLYRVCHNRYRDDLSGNGAKIHGGRWNSPGFPVVYTSSTKSLAVLECLANTPAVVLQNNFVVLTIETQGGFSIYEIVPKDLPADWRQFPAPAYLARLGDKWLKSGVNLLLQVPSVVIPSEFNYLINPLHPGAEKVKILAIEELLLDTRIREQL
jgi:RES domain-containing protein